MKADIAAKPVVPPKKVNTAKIDARQYSIADLQMATDSFNIDNLIGEGSFGRVYRAQFDDGKVLAVKKINSCALQNPEDFLDIVSEISRLHHPNVTELMRKANSRVKIALGTERALDARTRSEQSPVRWATPQLHDIDALAKTDDPALEGLYPAKSLSRFADVIALCVRVICRTGSV
ncbi:hypothetical protein RDI58_024127 [Solanum bulbocastanum]|uniref:Protein kinase domain-containing protein n=1 Tax=Solanum bulbocastanum TaxID=147425 RepID=A0AAN8SX40_SOLBU